MITKLWKAFTAWHNAAPAPIEVAVVEQPKKPKPKPRIYWKFYPKSNRGFWHVSTMPKGSWHDPETKKLWDEAHTKVHELNAKIGKRK